MSYLLHITEGLMAVTLALLLLSWTDIFIRVITLCVLGFCWVLNYRMDSDTYTYSVI